MSCKDTKKAAYLLNRYTTFNIVYYLFGNLLLPSYSPSLLPSFSPSLLHFYPPMTSLTSNNTTGIVTKKMPMKSIITPDLIIFVIGT